MALIRFYTTIAKCFYKLSFTCDYFDDMHFYVILALTYFLVKSVVKLGIQFPFVGLFRSNLLIFPLLFSPHPPHQLPMNSFIPSHQETMEPPPKQTMSDTRNRTIYTREEPRSCNVVLNYSELVDSTKQHHCHNYETTSVHYAVT